MTSSILKNLKVIIIGGSIGGLSCGLELLKYGANVKIFERSAVTLQSRGAGLGTVPHLVNRFRPLPVDGVSKREDNMDIFLQHDGVHVNTQEGLDQHHRSGPRYVTNWDLLWNRFRSAFPDEDYHMNSTLASITQQEGKVIVGFEDGRTEECDLLVCADGAHSTARSLLLPITEKPRYVGYFLWRGLLEEESIPAELRESFFKRLELHLYHNEESQFVVYPVPGKNGNKNPGKRRLNWGWYYNFQEKDLEKFLIDKEGTQRSTSIPPGYVKDEAIQQLRKEVAQKWPKELHTLVNETENPFVQVLFEYTPKKLAFDRVCLLGDAGHVARPHIGAGTSLAMEDSISLVSSLVKFAQKSLKEAEWKENIPSALLLYEKERLPTVQYMVQQGTEIGRSMIKNSI